jgi:hypothetical protein
LTIGEIIKNTASIYFDYNLPVRTNTQHTIVFRNNIITGVNNPQVDMSSMKMFPNPTGEKIWLKVKDVGRGNAVVSLIDINGRIIMRKELGNISLADFTTSLDLTQLPPGFYTILLTVGKKHYSQKLVVQ